MLFDILGPLQVRDAGRPLHLGRPKQRAVLAILLLDAGTVVSLDRLVEEVWGRRSPPQALASVQAYVSHLRRLLEPHRTPGAPATVIVNQSPGYRIVVGAGELDAARFQYLTQIGHDLLQQGQAPRAAEVLEEALGLWRGPVLADFADASFVQAERARLEDLRLTALEDRLSADLQIGRHGLIVAQLEQLTAMNPFRERLQGLRMAALYRCGRQAEALQSYQQFREHLREELGLDPGQALRGLERDILRQAPQLDWTAGSTAHESASRPISALDLPRSVLDEAEASAPAGPGDMVGRHAHIRTIDQALAGTSTGHGRLVLVAGEPGIGKTRLAQEATRRARESGVTVTWGRSDQDAGAPPFWPWTQILRELLGDRPPRPCLTELGVDAGELAPILPELTDGHLRAAAPVIDPEASRFRLCMAAVTTLLQLSRGRRLLVVLDDLQWADIGSHRLLSHLATALVDAPVVVLVTYRDTNVDGGELLADTLAELARVEPVDRLQLVGLRAADVAQVVASQSGSEPDDEVVQLITDRTGGNPFFVLEVLRLLASHGWPRVTPGDAASLLSQQIPAGVRDVLRRRLARLPDQTRAVLLVAAVIGHDFALDVVRAVTGMDDDEALAAVELTVAAGLVVEDSTRVGRFRFAHALVHEAIYGEISRARRARLHARVGQALLDQHGGDPEHLLQLAQHWWLAAPVVGAEQVIPHVIAAADRCLDTLAHEEAERQLRRGLELLAAAPPSTNRTTSEFGLHLRLGTLLVGAQLRLGRLLVQPEGIATEEAETSLARARELAGELGDTSAVFAAHRGLFEVALARADHRSAEELAEDMRHIAQSSGDRSGLIVSQLALGRALWSQGRLTAAREHLEHGLRLTTEVDQSRELLRPAVTLRLQLAAVLDALGQSHAAAGHLDTAVEDSQEEPPFARVAVLTGAALVAGLRRDVEEARRWATAAVDLAAQWTVTASSGYAAVVLGWVDAMEGGSEAAIPDLRRRLDEIEAGGVQHLVPWGLGLLAEAHLRQDEPAEALRIIDDALARVERTGERLHEAELHRLRALALLASDPPRLAWARSAIEKSARIAREQDCVLLQQRASETTVTAGLAPHTGSRSQPNPRA